MVRKTSAEVLEDLRQKVADAEAKVAAKAAADEAKAEEKAKAATDRITKAIARKTEQRDTLDTEIAKLNLELAGIEVDEIVDGDVQLSLVEDEAV